ncbi:MAG: ATP-dependent RecD-like DNA helicase, partial [Oribacterium sp.]|nr:ATP-dependent RecD-like DNA helicase [Oribacterium sp.]
MTKIRCVVERITYQNPENGYSVLKCRVKDYSDLVPVIGNLLDANVGSVLLVEGNWKVDAKYGRQFVAENWEETLPATVYGMEKYLGSGLIKGVGPKFAKKIVQRFGVDTFTVIEDNVELLIEIEGIGNKRIQMIAESWLKQKEVKNIMLFLQEHQVSTSFAAKIYKQYGNDSIPVMKENPYRLADDIWGIGFKTADQIAEKLGFGKESYVRLRSGLMYTLSELSNDGHVYAEKRQLIDAAVKLLEASEGTVAATMDDMLKKNELILERDLVKRNEDGEQVDPVYLPPFYYAEIGVAAKL